VTEQAAIDEDGHPFPTQFYVTCKYLVAAISASRGERRGRALVARRAGGRRLARSLADAQAEQRRIRPSSTRESRFDRSGSLKCLHAHGAFALARPGYELGDRILAELPSLWPDSCCTAD